MTTVRRLLRRTVVDSANVGSTTLSDTVEHDTLDHTGVPGVGSGGASLTVEEFNTDGAGAFTAFTDATTVTLSQTPSAVVLVARNGLIQSPAAGHYTVAGAVVTFAVALESTDTVLVVYS